MYHVTTNALLHLLHILPCTLYIRHAVCIYLGYLYYTLGANGPSG